MSPRLKNLTCRRFPQCCYAICEWRSRQSRMLPPSKAEPLPHEKKVDWSAASHQPPIPVEKLLTKEKRHQPHAAQENPERHLMAPQRDHRGSPSVSPGGRPGLVKHVPPALRTLDPNSKNCPQSKKRAGNRSREYRQNRKPQSHKRPDHRHQLHVPESHSFHAAPAQINNSHAVQERRSHRRTEQCIEQRK